MPVPSCPGPAGAAGRRGCPPAASPRGMGECPGTSVGPAPARPRPLPCGLSPVPVTRTHAALQGQA